jgi:hypothetical protein
MCWLRHPFSEESQVGLKGIEAIPGKGWELFLPQLVTDWHREDEWGLPGSGLLESYV